MERRWVCVLFLICASFPAPANPLREAKKAEQKNDFQRAFQEYSKWMEAQPNLDKDMEIPLKAFEFAPDLEKSVKFLEKALSKLKEPANRAKVLGLIGSLWERVMAFEPASRAYKTAYQEYPSVSSLPYLFRHALLLYEIGEMEESERQTRFVLSLVEKPEDRWEAQLHLARIFAATNRLQDALTVGRRLREELEKQEKDAGTILYFLYTLASANGLTQEAEQYRNALEQRGGIFRGLVQGKGNAKIVPLPLPSLFFAPWKSAPSPTTAKSTLSSGSSGGSRPPSTQRATAIQVGSFSQRENAEYLAKDLQRIGFAATVKQEELKNNLTVFRTVIPISPETATAADPQTLLVRLKEYGYEGFFLFENRTD